MTTDFAWAEDIVAHGLGALKRLNGFYHDNFVAEHDGRNYLIRIKNDAADEMDIAALDEDDVLLFLERQGYPAPRLLYQSVVGQFSVHSFIDGVVLSDLFPKDRTLPEVMIASIASGMADLHKLQPDWYEGRRLLELPTDNLAFYDFLIKNVEQLYKRLWSQNPGLYAEHDFPADPVAVLREKRETLASRPSVFCHGDIHQHNLMVRPNSTEIIAIDWERAIIADPMYDVARHFNCSHYARPERSYFMGCYLEARGISDGISWRRDVGTYLIVEHIKSAIVDVYRHHENKAERMSKSTLGDSQKRREWLQKVLERAHKIWNHETF